MSHGRIELSDVQKRVINHDRGYLRIVACPGSGKTETVSRRVAELVKKGVKPSTIVAFTFTNKAADGLKSRIRTMLEEWGGRRDVGDMYVGTIDSFCLYMLKRIKPEYRSFEILDSARRAAFVDRWYNALGLADLADLGKWRTMAKFCRSVDRAVTEGVDMSSISDEAFVSCYEAYTKKLREERFFDFISIIATLLDTLERDPAALAQVSREVKHVVFDEYQDVNKLQETLLEFLSRGVDSICVVGDDDQNIFQWRGSDISHIRDFSERYDRRYVTTENLSVNYRATDALVRVASRLAARNTKRIPKNMRAYEQKGKFESGDIVRHHFATDTEEFEYVCDTMDCLRGTEFEEKGVARPLSYRDMAVIVRTNEDAARIMRHMSERRIPCVADSGTSVFERPVVSLALDCIMYAFGRDGYQTDGVPDPAELEGRYAEAVPSGDVRAFSKGLEAVKGRAEAVIAKGFRDWLPNLGLQEFYHRIVNAMGAERGCLSDADMYNLAVLSAAISDYEYVYRSLRARQVGGLQWFISQFAENEYADPARGDPGQVDAVRVLTIWKAKGLEFPAVFVPSFDKRRRPNPSQVFIDDGLYDKARYDGGDEDDRRAYYTAVTRSQKYLFLTSAERREICASQPLPKKSRKPSPFLDEMDGAEFSPAAPIGRPKMEGGAGAARVDLIQSSYSELSMYDRCPHDYRIRHVMGFSAGVPAAFGYGTNIHNILNHLHAGFAQNGAVPDEEYIRKVFDRMFYLRFAPGAVNENMKKAGIRVVLNYMRLHGGDFERILETEKRFEFTVGGALISGSIDLLKRVGDDGAGGIEIIDFKSDRRGDDGRYELDHSEQVRFYAYAVQESLGSRPAVATIHHLDTQAREPVDISGAALDATKKRIAEKVDLIRSRSFDPAPDEVKCRGCDFRALCPHKGFEVGTEFGTTKSEKRENDTVRADDAPPPGELRQSLVSDSVRRKAEKLAAALIVRNPDGSHAVPSSSNPGKSYTVSADLKCQCKGFKKYPEWYPGFVPTCSHVEAVKIYSRRA